MPPYVSPLREAQAAQTRRRILEAAVAVFGESGYAGASLARIAREAGVSLETVKQNGPKAALLLAAFDHAFAGEEGDGPLGERESVQGFLDVPADRLPAFTASFIAEANARVARLWPRLVEAGSGDPDVAARLEALRRNRAADMAALVALLRERGLCDAADEAEASRRAAALSFLISPEGYTQLVLESGWDVDAYRAWIERAITRMVLR